LYTSDTISNPGENAGSDIEKTIRSYWQNEFMNLIQVKEPESDEFTIGSDYEQYRGKIIRNVYIRQLKVFGQTVSDTGQTPTRWVETLGNELHINTQTKLLEEKLFIDQGDSLNPFTLADNERLIRSLPYIKNVKVILSEVENDSVDILFLTKDVFSLGFGLELFDVSYGKAGIWNNNLLGLGHEFYYYLTWNFDKSQNYGHFARYRIQNIRNTFITAEAYYEDRWNLKTYKISFNRNFITPEMKYAGGIGYENIKSTLDIELPDTILTDKNLDYDFLDFWLGHSILLAQSYKKRKRTNMAFTCRLMRYDYFKRPEIVSSDFLHNYHDRTIILGGIGISNQAYQKSYLVYGFGKPEDIPYGVLGTLTLGFEKGEYINRPYLGFSYSFGTPGQRFGFLFYRIEYGTFFNERMEQGTLAVTFKNFSPLLNSPGRYKYRLFTTVNYKTGIQRFNDEFIKLEDNDVRGLKSQSPKGNQRLSINIESICYSPHYILGFRFLYFLFIDAGMVGEKNEILLQNSLYTGLGAGIKIKNENLVFNTIELRFAYYPLPPDDSSPEYFYLSGIPNVKPESFIIPKPGIIEY
jgi:hypothetical protein